MPEGFKENEGEEIPPSTFRQIHSMAWHGWVRLESDGRLSFNDKEDQGSSYGGIKRYVSPENVTDLDNLQFSFFIPPEEEGVAGTFDIVGYYRDALERNKETIRSGDASHISPSASYKSKVE